MEVNKLKGETLITLADKQYKARLTMSSIMAIESQIGMGIIKLAQQMGDGDIMLSHVVNVLTPALRGGGNDLQQNDVLDLIEKAGLVQSTAVVANLLAATLSDNSEEKKEEGKVEQGE